MKIAVVTASIGSISPVSFKKKFENADYYSFTDLPSSSDSYWQNKKVINFTCENNFVNRRNAKIYKVLTHFFLPNYDYYIWLDSTHALNQDPNELIESYLNTKDIALFKHSKRNCIYEEGIEIIRKKQDVVSKVERQMDFYKSKKYPSNNGLYELSAFIKKNNSKVNSAMLSWWEQICMYSSRDQLSFPYVLKLHGIKPAILKGKARGRLSNRYLPQIKNWSHDRTI